MAELFTRKKMMKELIVSLQALQPHVNSPERMTWILAELHNYKLPTAYTQETLQFILKMLDDMPEMMSTQPSNIDLKAAIKTLQSHVGSPDIKMVSVDNPIPAPHTLETLHFIFSLLQQMPEIMTTQPYDNRLKMLYGYCIAQFSAKPKLAVTEIRRPFTPKP